MKEGMPIVECSGWLISKIVLIVINLVVFIYDVYVFRNILVCFFVV